jgi:hypothetical protein
MATRKSFALRIDGKTYEAMQRWAKDDLRSLNAQIEFVLRESLRKSGRLRGPKASAAETGDAD